MSSVHTIAYSIPISCTDDSRYRRSSTHQQQQRSIVPVCVCVCVCVCVVSCVLHT